MPFSSKEDAIRFAERQGKPANLTLYVPLLNQATFWNRLGLLCSATHCQAYPSQELRRELPASCRSQAQDSAYKVDRIVRSGI